MFRPQKHATITWHCNKLPGFVSDRARDPFTETIGFIKSVIATFKSHRRETFKFISFIVIRGLVGFRLQRHHHRLFCTERRSENLGNRSEVTFRRTNEFEILSFSLPFLGCTIPGNRHFDSGSPLQSFFFFPCAR